MQQTLPKNNLDPTLRTIFDLLEKERAHLNNYIDHKKRSHIYKQHPNPLTKTLSEHQTRESKKNWNEAMKCEKQIQKIANHASKKK